MSDNREIKQYHQPIPNSTEPISMDKLSAATSWQHYVPYRVDAPDIGEWCLWSIVENNKRDYFTGSLFMSGHLLMLSWDGFRPVVPNDTLYYARVNKMVFPEMSKKEFENKLSELEFRKEYEGSFETG